MSELLLQEKLRSSEVDTEVRNVARVRTITVLTQLDARRIGYIFAFLREAGLMSTSSNDNMVSMDHADLRGVNWSQANLSDANLSRADLSKADLSRADLSKATLEYANLSDAFLFNTNLSDTFLFNTNLNDADLSQANLSGAYVTDEQLAKAKSLIGAIMPDGTIHD